MGVFCKSHGNHKEMSIEDIQKKNVIKACHYKIQSKRVTKKEKKESQDRKHWTKWANNYLSMLASLCVSNII